MGQIGCSCQCIIIILAINIMIVVSPMVKSGNQNNKIYFVESASIFLNSQYTIEGVVSSGVIFLKHDVVVD